MTNLWLTFNAYSKANPMIAGAVSLWGLSVVTWLCRKLPAQIWSKIHSQITTKLDFDNTEHGWARENYAAFMTWFMENDWVKYSRSHSLQSHGPVIDDRWRRREGENAAEIAMGAGNHFFFYKRRLFILKREMIPQTGQNNLIYKISLTMFGRKKQILQDLVDEFSYKFMPGRQNILRWTAHGWEVYSALDRRELSTVIIDQFVKDQLVAEIKDFFENEQRWTSKGLPYKKTIVLHGVPGTGKTSLIKGIATHFALNVCRLNLSSISDEMLEGALASLPSRSLLAIEDFDSTKATHARKGVKSGVKKESSEAAIGNKDGDKGQIDLFSDMLTLSGILNAFDGIASLHGSLIFLSTNALDQIDPALLRKGRVDRIIEIKPLTHKEVVQYIELMYPGQPIPNTRFLDILGCDLQGHYFDHPDDYEGFINAVPKESASIRQLVQHEAA